MSQIGCNTRSTAKASGSSNPLSSTQPSQPPLPVISSRSSFSNVSVPAANDSLIPLGTVPPISEEITDPPRGSVEANIVEPRVITPDAPVVPEVTEDLANSKLASAVELLTSKLSSITERKPKSTVKPRAPDVFDGTDPAKLETFLFQLSMYFSTCRDNFRDDESRVTFAISYLKGIPLDWTQDEFSQSLVEDDVEPSWFFDYSEFTKELKRMFGPRDGAADAAASLERLRFKDNAKAIRFNLDFNRHARKTGWNEATLSRSYYNSLPTRLKDELARLDRPDDLPGLQELVAKINCRYWERQSKIHREKQAAVPNTKKTSTTPTSENPDPPTRQNRTPKEGSSNPAPQKNANQKGASGGSSSGQGKNSPSIADVLGPDGKLKPEERKRCLDHNLCLRCGGSGHKVDACPRVPKPRPRGRATNATSQGAMTSNSPATPSATAPGSGKV